MIPHDDQPEQTTLPALDQFVVSARAIVDNIETLIAELQALRDQAEGTS